MQSVLEQEVSRLWLRLRDWLRQRDRAVLFGVLLCAVPFLPVTFVGVVMTCINLLLLRAGKIPRQDLPLMVFGLAIAAFYVALWWVLFTFVVGSGLWYVPRQVLDFLLNLVPMRRHDFGIPV